MPTPLPITRLARFELARFRGLLPRLALVFVLLVPLLYGAIYLSANWDPYGKVDRLPVAVVDQDVPVSYDGRPVHAGADLVASLQRERAFDWRVTDAAAAQAGLTEGDYFMIVTIPPTFSADLVSGAGPEPRRAGVQLRRDDANGFVVGSITGKAEDSIELAVDSSAVGSYFGAVFDNLDTIRSGTAEATDGAAQLESGLGEAKDGSHDLRAGAAKAEQGSADLSAGAGEVADGAEKARSGTATLDGGLATLESGSADLADGADQVAAGTQQLNDRVLPVLDAVEADLPKIEADADAITAAAADLSGDGADLAGGVHDDLAGAQQDLAALEAAHPELADDPAWQRLTGHVADAEGQAGDLAASADEIAARAAAIRSRVSGSAASGGLQAQIDQAQRDLTDLNDGAHQVADGAHDLHAGLVDAHQGSGALLAGLTTLADGAQQLDDGATTLHDGLVDLSSGATRLDRGIGDLRDGATQLHQGLADALARMPSLTPSEQAAAAQVLSSPADVVSQVDHPAGYYGRGLAPLFFSIALWVCGISVFMVLRPITGRMLTGRAHPARLALTAWLPIGGIAMAGGLIMVGVVWLTLGLDPVHGWWLVGLTLLGAICFSAIAHLLRVALGTVASAVTLVWLILQLPSSGGTFPSELLPGFFSAIAPAMPMTYLIDGFRVVISGGQPSHLVTDVVVLAAITVLALGLCAVVVGRRQQLRLRDLHPPLPAP